MNKEDIIKLIKYLIENTQLVKANNKGSYSEPLKKMILESY